MAWVTPKINWADGDYYNAEDIERISGNLNHVISMAGSIFPDTEIAFLSLSDQRKFSFNYCQGMFLTLDDMVVHGAEDYLTENKTIGQLDCENLYTIYKLKLLWTIYEQANYTVPYITLNDAYAYKIKIPAAIGEIEPIYYEGCGYCETGDLRNFFIESEIPGAPRPKAYDPPYIICDPVTYRDPIYSVYSLKNEDTETITGYLISSMMLEGCYFGVSRYNTSFWTATNLNVIEKEILALYTKFDGALS